MSVAPRLLLPLALLGAMTSPAMAQGMPSSQPGILSIIIEDIKVGMESAHAANEAGWPRAFGKANSPYYYMAFESMTGESQIWYVSPYESFAAQGESMKANQSDPALAAELDRLWRADAEYLNSATTIQAVARPDLSYGPFPNLAMVRYYDISIIRVRLGHEQEWEEAARAYMEVVRRGAPGASYRIYEVINGWPDGYFLAFSTANDYAEFDAKMAAMQGMWGQATAAEMETLQGFLASGAQSMVTQRFSVSPTMSYVSPEARAQAPDFWR